MLPVIDNLALFRMASEKVSWEARKKKRERGEKKKCYHESIPREDDTQQTPKISVGRHLHYCTVR